MRLSRLVAFFCLLLLLGSCRKPVDVLSASPWPELTAAEEEKAARILTGLTAGLVGKRQPLEFEFAWPIVSDEEVGKEADAAWLSITPSLKGKLVWKSPQTLVFEPGEDIRPEHYAASLDLPTVVHDASLPKVPFGFMARPQDISWELTDFVTGKDGNWSVDGQVTFTDAPTPKELEKMVEANQDGRTLSVSWSGAGTRRVLSVQGIQRSAIPLFLTWQKDAGAADKRIDTVTIPRPGELGLMGVRTDDASGDLSRFSAVFSEPLGNIDGLVRFSREGWTAAKDGNRLICQGKSRRAGNVVVTLDAGLSSANGQKLSKTTVFTRRIGDRSPQVRFLRSGAILPTSAMDRLPFETMNLSRVEVKVTRVSAANIPEFLADGKLDQESSRLTRLGTVVHDRVLNVGAKADEPWSGGLDLRPVLNNAGAGLFVIQLRKVRSGNLFACAEGKVENGRKPSTPQDDAGGDGEGEDGEESSSSWKDRNDPCKASFWNDWYGQTAQVNVLVSDLGLMAFQDAQGYVSVTATNLIKAAPWEGVDIELLDPADRVLAKSKSDAQGFATLKGGSRAALVRAHIADKGFTHQGYLRLRGEESRNVSRFDVEGEAGADGLKAFLYTERGVYRPGDSIFVGCLLRGEDNQPVEKLPMRFSLKDPQGRIVASQVLRAAPDGHFGWRTATRPEDPTGRWQVVSEAGPVTSVKSIMVEAIRPNRLKIENDAEGRVFGKGAGTRVQLSARWLSGGSAASLACKVSTVLSPRPLTVKGMADFSFTDPTARLPEAIPEKSLFEGRLDAGGKASFSLNGLEKGDYTGLMNAVITSRVFEEGGQASTDACGAIVSPFSHYAGLHVQGADRWGWVPSGTPLRIELASVTPAGVAVKGRAVDVEIWSRRDWWWWESGEHQTSFTTREGVTKVATLHGTSSGSVAFTPEAGGTLLVLVRDKQSGHVAGKFLEVWGSGDDGEGSEGKAPSLLPLTPVADSVNVGQKLSVRFPGAPQGKALVQVLRGRRILSQEWMSLHEGQMEWSTQATAAMSPGVYVQVNLIQPYPPANERPLRVWGVVPVAVIDPTTRLKLEIQAPAELRPNTKATITLKNLSGRKGRVVVAVVDEGLLDLTRFKTPDPWKGLHAKEALSIRSWDLFDEVFGAFSGKLDGILAVGGDENRIKNPGARKNDEFPPMVWVSSPMDLPAGNTTVSFPIPQYTGSVRVMAIASSGEASGSTQAAVPVRAPVMVLPSAPRAMSPGDRATVPVTVFSSKPGAVQVSLKTSGALKGTGILTKTVEFPAAGSQVAAFEIAASAVLGTATLTVEATAAHGQAEQKVPVLVRMPGDAHGRSEMGLAGTTAWTHDLKPLFLPGTASDRLEISSLGAVGIEGRIDELLEYPHGCVEQTTSAAFPQLFLNDLLPDADAVRLKAAENNVKAAIERLRRFQTPSGALSLWPGESQGYEWGTLWAARFLALARARGYEVPSSQWDPLFRHLAQAAKGWNPNVYTTRWDTLTQVQRLDVLAQTGKPELAEMNRLREAKLPSLSRWILAAAYATSGQKDVAGNLTKGLDISPLSGGRMLGEVLGSPIRDRALILEAMVRTGNTALAPQLFQDLRRQLASGGWWSTQETGTSLWAFAGWLGKLPKGTEASVEWRLAGGAWNRLSTRKGRASAALPDRASGLLEVRSPNGKPVEVLLRRHGVVPPGSEPANRPANLEISRTWRTSAGAPVDPDRVPQGTELVCETTVRNKATQTLSNLALSQIWPGGMEIRNDRLENASAQQTPSSGSFERIEFRDDRTVHYFSLAPNESRKVVVRLRAAWAGSFARPAAVVEALYDAQFSAWARGGTTLIAAP